MKYFLLLFFTFPCFAQLPDSPTPKLIEHITLTGLNETFSMLDASSSREAIQIKGTYEIDPLHKPFVHSNSLYAIQSFEVAGASYLGWKMQSSKIPIIHNLWFAPQAGLLAANVWGWKHNENLIERNKAYGRKK